jgi:hypothetical protein
MDHRFIVKTTSAQEAFCLLRRLRSYHKYMKDNPRTFLTRFLGCHFIQMYGKRMFFVVMVNFLAGATKIHEKYDLKGSWENRNGKVPCRTTYAAPYGSLALSCRCDHWATVLPVGCPLPSGWVCLVTEACHGRPRDLPPVQPVIHRRHGRPVHARTERVRQR